MRQIIPMLPNRKIIIGITIPLVLFIIFDSMGGLLMPSIYAAETPNWFMQTHSQDFIDLVLVMPVLVVSCIYTAKGKVFGLYVCGGAYLYLSYTFTIYTFALHFNSLFLCYCITFGLSVYGLIYIFYCLLIHPQKLQARQINRDLFMSWYFIGIAIFFSVLWLSEIVPALLYHQLPASIILTGLLVNPVQALDLSLLLPLVFMTGLWIKQGKIIGKILAPVISTFFVLVSLTIAIIALFISGNENLPVIIIMVLMALVSLLLLFHSFKGMQQSLVT